MRCHIQPVASHLGLHCLLMYLVYMSFVLIKLTEDLFLDYFNPLWTRNPLTGTLAHSEDPNEMNSLLMLNLSSEKDRPLAKSAYQKIILLFLNQNISCEYSKETSQ